LPPTEIKMAEPTQIHPFLHELESLASESLISEDMERWLRERHDAKDKMLNSVFNTLK